MVLVLVLVLAPGLVPELELELVPVPALVQHSLPQTVLLSLLPRR